MLAQADDVTGAKPLFFPQRLAVPRDQRAPTRLEACGTGVAVATEAAVSRKDVGGIEEEIGLRSFVTFAGAAKPNVRSGEQVDDKVLGTELGHDG